MHQLRGLACKFRGQSLTRVDNLKRHNYGDMPHAARYWKVCFWRIFLKFRISIGEIFPMLFVLSPPNPLFFGLLKSQEHSIVILVLCLANTEASRAQ